MTNNFLNQYSKTLAKVNFIRLHFFDLAKVLATTNSEPG